MDRGSHEPLAGARRRRAGHGVGSAPEQSHELIADGGHSRAVAEQLGDRTHGVILPSVVIPRNLERGPSREPPKIRRPSHVRLFAGCGSTIDMFRGRRQPCAE